MTSAIDLVKLTPLMQYTTGTPEFMIGMIDGPVSASHPDLPGDTIRRLSETSAENNLAHQHGTFIAGILSAKRGSAAPAICPGCSLLVRPIFGDAQSATTEELAQAIHDCMRAGARVLNISAAIVQPAAKSDRALEEALDTAARRGVIVVSASGNQGTIGGTAITRHAWVIPVAACDLAGRPLGSSNFGKSVGRNGLRAPGDQVVSLGSGGGHVTSGGTSVAAPFVTGAIALLWSLLPQATAMRIKLAITQLSTRRRSVVPPLLDAWAAYQSAARDLAY